MINVNSTELIFWIVSIGGIIFGISLLIALFHNHSKERDIERKIEAILNGEINSYEEWLLWQLNIGETKETCALSYEDYLIRELNRRQTKTLETRRE